MDEDCDANVTRKRATFFNGTVTVTSELNHILHVASSRCVMKIYMIKAYVEDIGIFI